MGKTNKYSNPHPFVSTPTIWLQFLKLQNWSDPLPSIQKENNQSSRIRSQAYPTTLPTSTRATMQHRHSSYMSMPRQITTLQTRPWWKILRQYMSISFSTHSSSMFYLDHWYQLSHTLFFLLLAPGIFPHSSLLGFIKLENTGWARRSSEPHYRSVHACYVYKALQCIRCTSIY